MALPKAVQQLAEEADRIVEGLNGDKPGQDPEGTNPETGAENVNTDPPQDPGMQDPPAEGNDNSTETKPAPVQPEETWMQKYHILQGKYDAEVPRLHAQLREMQGQVQQLIEAKAEAEAKAKQAPEPEKSLVTEQDKEAFGSDLIDLIERATEAKVSKLRDRETRLLDEIEKLKSQLGNVSERQEFSDKDRYLMGLSQKVPDWEQLNVDPSFLAWLSEVDPVYGVSRQVALTNAHEAMDSGRVAAVFNAYKATVAPKQTEKPKASQELNRQVAPTRSRATNAPSASDSNARIWTQAEIGQFYEEWRRGFLDNEEAARIEKEIAAASAEGRVR